MKIAVSLALVILLVLLGGNLIWPSRSTARISNAGTEALQSVVVHVNEQQIPLGELMPGKSRLIFLPASGEATLKLSYQRAGALETSCQEYIEGEMYHVEGVLESELGSSCTTTLPLFSELFILKIL